MSLGEKAQITIEPEWGYGKRGLEGKYPFNTTTQQLWWYLKKRQSVPQCIFLEFVCILDLW